MSFSKNELIPIYLKARQNELLQILQRFSDASMLNLGFEKYFPAKLYGTFLNKKEIYSLPLFDLIYDSMPDLGEIEVYQRADFQSGSRVLKKVF